MKKTSLREAVAQVVSDYDQVAGFDLSEVWSDAARAASAAARAARKKGGDWQHAGRAAFYRSKDGQAIAVKSLNRTRRDAEDGTSFKVRDGRTTFDGSKLKRYQAKAERGVKSSGWSKVSSKHLSAVLRRNATKSLPAGAGPMISSTKWQRRQPGY